MSGSQPPRQQGSRWGSLLSGAVAGLESRLDTILADDETKVAEEAARNTRLATLQGQSPSKTESQDASRASSKSRVNDRLQERLAKAAKTGGTRPGSEVPSRTASPRLSGTIARASVDSKPEDVGSEGLVTGDGTVGTANQEGRESKEELVVDKSGDSIATDRPSTSALDALSIQSTRPSQDSARPSSESCSPTEDAATAVPLKRSQSFLESEITRFSQTQEENSRNYQEELHAHLERIDALQSKLAYLAGQASAAAREAASSATPGTLEKRLAEQEEKNAELLEEGNKLSKNEIKQRGAIMKLRQRVQEQEKESAELKRKLATSEEEKDDYRNRLRIIEEKERAAQTRLKFIPKLEVELDSARRDGDNAMLEVSSLKKQLVDAKRRAEIAEKRAQTDKLDEQMRVVAELNDELSNARIEKRLIEERGKKEIHQLKEDTMRQQEKANLVELELRSEIQNLETKLEMLRSKSEEVTSSTATDAQAKLLRQVETLQTQYALASQNWQTLESTLNSRIAALEKERDEISKRETDVRKKAREINAKARRYEEELEGEKDKASTFETELNEQKAALAKMQTRLSSADAAMLEAKAEIERERKMWEKETLAKIEEEKSKWKQDHAQSNPMSASASIAEHNHFLRTESPTASYSNRKIQNPELLGMYSRRNNPGGRTFSSELAPIMTDRDRPPSRRMPVRTPTDSTQYSRDAGYLNGSLPPSASISLAPSIDIEGLDDRLDRDRDRDSTSSPHRTVNELVSVSTMGAGPSVQLVERMSAAVRRLESEKAAAKEEYVRLVAQRDEAREEYVGLMRETENLRKDRERMGVLEKEMREVKTRYEASLEMLGEKQEEVEELRDDLKEVKRIYRELAERSMK